MGMSASQARLIQLTARMSDVEYEGQQINQQRLAISNKISDIYAQMENMVVPTAPSPYDYMITDYKGADNDGNEVGVKANKDGSFTVSVPVTGDTLKASGEAMDVQSTEVEKPEAHNSITATYTPEVKKEGFRYSNELNGEAKNYTKEEHATDLQKANTNKTNAEGEYTKAEKAVTDHNSEKPQESDFVDDEGKPIPGAYSEALQAWQQAHTALETTRDEKLADKNDKTTIYNQVNQAEPFDYYELDEGKQETVTSANGECAAIAKYHPHGIDNLDGEGEEIEYTYTDSFGAEKKGNADALTLASSGYSQDQVKDLCKLYKEDGSQITTEDFDPESGALTYDGKLYSEPAKEKVGSGSGGQVYSYDQAKSEHGADKNWADFEKRLKRAVRAQLNVDDSQKDALVEAELSNWRIQVNGEGENATFTAYRIGEDGKAQRYENGTDTYYEDFVGNPKYNKSGNLGGVEYTDEDGNTQTVSAKKSEELDDTAYGAAMSQYEADKAEYDRQQDALNHETSKWQLEDKKLDLKLKRLDTERNALNTEIDAVKKVIQDATEHGFKTFSG